MDLIVISAGTGEVNDKLDWHIEHETIKTNVTGFAALSGVAMLLKLIPAGIYKNL